MLVLSTVNLCICLSLRAQQTPANKGKNKPINSESDSTTSLEKLYEAVKVSPESFRAHLDLGIALSDRGQWQRATSELNTALQLKPENPEATYDLGLTHLKIAKAMTDRHSTEYFRELDMAQKSLLDALRLDPNLPGIHGHLGWLYHKIGDQAMAVQEFRAEVKSEPKNGTAYNNLGTALAELQNYSEAIDAYDEALQLSPRLASAAINWEGAIRRAGKGAEILAEYKKRPQPFPAATHLQFGIVLLIDGEMQKAVVEFRTALKMMPGLAAAHFYLGNIFYDQNQIASAEHEYRLAIQESADKAEFWSALGRVLMAQEKPKEAETALRRALDLNPQDSSLLYKLGRTLQMEGKTQEAKKKFEESIQLKHQAQKDGQVEMLLQKGIQDLRAGNFKDAAQTLREAVALDPIHPETNYYLGIALSQTGDMESSKAAFEQALQRRPESAEIHYNFGIALWQHGESSEAMSEFRRAVSLRPDDGLARCALGLSLLRSGHAAEGRSEISQAQSLGACTDTQ